MSLRIDHVTVAGRDLDLLRQQFAALGLPNAYGGTHANGVTHMATLGLGDGSYIELIATLRPGQPSPWWDPFIRADAGPCAWAVEVDDVAAVAQRAQAAGIAVRGPIGMGRTRPDGRQVEWDLAFLDDGEPGTRLPFVIHDRTPRRWRIEPSPALESLGLTGVARVIAVTPSLETSLDRYRAAFDLEPSGEPKMHEADQLHAVALADAPLVLVQPQAHADSAIARRLAALGPSPVAFLLGAANLADVVKRLPTAAPARFLGEPVYWLIEGQLGIVQA